MKFKKTKEAGLQQNNYYSKKLLFLISQYKVSTKLCFNQDV